MIDPGWNEETMEWFLELLSTSEERKEGCS